ncbi:hypothetical protein SKB0092_04190 [Roseomonas mucosa]
MRAGGDAERLAVALDAWEAVDGDMIEYGCDDATEDAFRAVSAFYEAMWDDGEWVAAGSMPLVEPWLPDGGSVGGKRLVLLARLIAAWAGLSVPKGCAIRFRDGDALDLRPKNLEVVKKGKQQGFHEREAPPRIMAQH